MTSLTDPAANADALAWARHALAEDVGSGDATTLALVPAGARARAVVLTKSHCVVAGSSVARLVWNVTDPSLEVKEGVADGRFVPPGTVLVEIAGEARSILTGERTALNVMQRMSGIATLTKAFVDRVARYGTAILDTRKTTPGLRWLEKYAVRCGGGQNHRMGLYDRVLVKDNHRRFWSGGAGLRLDEAVRVARSRCPGLPVEVEVESEAELRNVLPACPDWVLLDNMEVGAMAVCVGLCRGVCKTEASGGIRLDNVEAVAATGVDAISIGALTHSAPAADLSLELVEDVHSAR
jgi:nicotinate-nucleotide pyrophosphorylase (carboxylating)